MVEWDDIETVLLDMDGTLLDLHFDDHFWQVSIPRAWAARNGVDEVRAISELKPVFTEIEATLDWYCLDFWSDRLDMDVFALAREITHLVSLRPHVEEFLEYLLARDKEVILVTNSHEKFLHMKMGITGIDQYFRHMFNAHEFGEPKEAPRFWQLLENRVNIDRNRTVLIDDNHDVLRSAAEHGIRFLLSIAQPNSRREARKTTGFPAVHCFRDLCR